jgi:hypothetical protein
MSNDQHLHSKWQVYELKNNEDGTTSFYTDSSSNHGSIPSNSSKSGITKAFINKAINIPDLKTNFSLRTNSFEIYNPLERSTNSPYCQPSSLAQPAKRVRVLSPRLESLINYLAVWESRIDFCLDPLDSCGLTELFATSSTSQKEQMPLIDINNLHSKSKITKAIKRKYLDYQTEFKALVYTFSIKGKITDEVLVLAFAYVIMILRDNEVDGSGFVQDIFSTCVLIAFKYLMDHQYWPLKEFVKMTTSNSSTLKKSEV